MSQLGSIRIGSSQSVRRQWSIRAKIVALLLAPLIPLLAMTIFTISVALGPARNLSNARISVDSAGVPAGVVVGALQQERALSVVYVSTPSRSPQVAAQLAIARAATDAAIANFESSTAKDTFLHAESALTRTNLANLQSALANLATDRQAIDGTATRAAVMTYYNDIVDSTLNVYGSIASLDDHTLARQANIVVGLAEASEMFAREDTLVSGAVAAGQMTSHDYTQLVGTIATQRRMFVNATRYLSTADQAVYQKIVDSPQYKQLRAMENTLVANPNIGSVPTVNPAAWRDDYSSVATALGLFEAAYATRTINATGTAATSRTVRLVLATTACLVMLCVLVLISIRIARTLIRRVAKLRMEALSLALDRLPSVVERLRRGDRVDVEAEAPPLEAGPDELGQLSEAFTRVQRTAVASAVHEATLRQGFNQVFLNIARRNQTLLHRQLALLDGMERRATDPDDLEELFRIDHLATRMRRHAEDLVILAGSTPGRGWRNPVPTADVLRAAASEVEEYARINVTGLPNLAVAGRAVSDVVHLLAELLENATLFSPPDTQVTMSGQVVPNGFAVEIEDRGLGMTRDAIEEANEQLMNPPDFDPAHSARLGLFVVARLAARHGIKVVLRRSPYGGVTAIALIPMDLIVAANELTREPNVSAIEMVGSREPGRSLALVAGVPRGGGPSGGSGPSGSGPSGGGGSSGGPRRGGTSAHGGVPAQSARHVDVGNADTIPTTPDGLPQRVRQVNLAQALRETPDAEVIEVDTPTMTRTPEKMRTMLASFQDGTMLGRRKAQAQADSGGVPGPTGAGHGSNETTLGDDGGQYDGGQYSGGHHDDGQYDGRQYDGGEHHDGGAHDDGGQYDGGQYEHTVHDGTATDEERHRR